MDENNNNTGFEIPDEKKEDMSVQMPSANVNDTPVYGQNTVNGSTGPQNGSNAGRTAYGQPGYTNNNATGYDPSGSGYTPPQSGYGQQPQNGYYEQPQNGYGQQSQGGYSQNGYSQNGYAQSGYNQNNYDRNNPANYNQYGYGQQNYGGYQNPYGGYAPRPSQGLAVASLVCGILGVMTSIAGFGFPILFLLPIAGLILGIVHKVKGIPLGKGMSTAGIVLSIIGMVLPIVLLIAVIANMPSLLDYVETMDPETYEEIYEEYADEMPGWFSES